MLSLRRSFSTTITKVSTGQTHRVFNQATPFFNVDVLQSDPTLLRALKHYQISEKDVKMLRKFGLQCCAESMQDMAKLAEKNRPTLRQFDNYGRRIDVVDYHPSYHTLMRNSLEAGVASYGYNHQYPGSFITRGALAYLNGQTEPGHGCPVTMTFAAVPVLRRHPYTQDWLKKTLHQGYDPRNVPMQEKDSVTIGMSMTEKQGGSDVRANTTTAVPIAPGAANPGDAFYINGHKWFTSAPMCDAFLTLAKIGGESATPSCFLVPRWLPDGSRNEGFHVMRLKDKLADRANASSEVEYNNAWGMLIGEEGKGVKTIIEMVQSTRLDCTIGSASGARRALLLAINHANSRRTFGSLLIDQPLMVSVLSELCAESEAHTLTAMRMSAAFDASERGDDREAELFRIGVAVSKYFVTKRLPNFTYECMEAMGGNGFVEDFPMAMLYRHAPLNSIWEGSGNVMVLDILRAGKSVPILLNEITQCKGLNQHMDRFIENLTQSVTELLSGNVLSIANQRHARNLADRLAIGLQASLLLRQGNPTSAKIYISSMIPSVEDNRGANYGSSSTRSVSHEEASALVQENIPVYVNA